MKIRGVDVSFSHRISLIRTGKTSYFPGPAVDSCLNQLIFSTMNFLKPKKKKYEEPVDPAASQRNSIFISYRRDDEPNAARAIANRLAREFGTSRVFFDVDSVTPGTYFEEELRRKLDSTRVLVVVIGPRWEHMMIERSHDKRDYVREEITSALKDNEVMIIPVLIRNAALPDPDKLPGAIRQIPLIQAEEIRHTKFESDLEKDVIRRIKEVLEPRTRKVLTKEVLIASKFLKGLNLQKEIQAEVAKQADDGWQLAGETLQTGNFFTGRKSGFVLIFQKPDDED